MALFRAEDIQQMADAYATVGTRAMDLTESLLVHPLTTLAAREFAHHGLGRRLSTLARCITRIFELLPPEEEGIPEREILLDATVYLQSFVFNTFGALDDLAFIWVCEKQVKKANGQPLPNGRIGLSRNMEEVRGSLSDALRDYLIQIDPWFSHLENYRHALGHRIPLYIPPYIIRHEDADRYSLLDEQARDALYRRRDVDEHLRLSAERDALRSFRPWMKHSFDDPAPPVAFHPQVLADFATVEEITRRVIADL